MALFEEGLRGWAVGDLIVRVRYSRGADFSGTCFYGDRRIYINLGRDLKYPYTLRTNLGKVKSTKTGWRRPEYTMDMPDAYMLVLFIFMHELYHLLVKKARRNTRQKESMCDRFAARHLVDNFSAVVRDASGKRVSRDLWNFQDLDGFVAAARDRHARRRPAASPTPLLVGESAQLLLFGTG